MGQRVTRPEISEGVKLYNGLKFAEAIEKWTRALAKSCNPKEKFVVLGYLITASFDRGKFRDMLVYSAQQIDIGHQLEDVELRAEAYLNLARSNAHVGEFHKALAYCRHCLSNETDDDRITANVYLCMGDSHHGLGEYTQAATNYGIALKLAKTHKDTLLECQINSGLGSLFVTLRDYDKSLFYHLRAAGLARELETCDIPAKFKRLTRYNLSIPNRKLGRLKEAMDYCEDAMKSAMTNEDRDLQSKCLSMFADIHRKRLQLQRALPRYESAYAITIETGNRTTQLEVLSGMAKACVLDKSFDKAIDLNEKALEAAENCASKPAMVLCHIRLAEVYKLHGDERMCEHHVIKGREKMQEIELKCPYCDGVIGETCAKLDLLPCGHICHQLCYRKVNRCSHERACPQCQPQRNENNDDEHIGNDIT